MVKKPFKDAGVRFPRALLVILLISAIGIVVFVAKGINMLGSGVSALAYFPIIMYLLMYISVIRYVFDFFRDSLDVSLSGVMMRYCALTGASLILAGDIVNYTIMVCTVFILILVPLIREDLKSPKKVYILSILILVAALVLSTTRLSIGLEAALLLPGFWTFVSIWDMCNVAILWILFFALYIMRVLQPQKELKQPEPKKKKSA